MAIFLLSMPLFITMVSADRERCPMCGGDGICPACHGDGWISKSEERWDLKYGTCPECGGSGICSYCGGDGWVGSDSSNGGSGAGNDEEDAGIILIIVPVVLLALAGVLIHFEGKRKPKCPKCGKVVYSDWTTCPCCGQSLENTDTNGPV